MRANEFLKEAIAPIAPISGNQPAAGQDQLGATIAQSQGQQQQKATPQQEDKDMPIIQGLRQVAAKQPVSKTGNAGIDSLLFDVAGLSSAPGGIAKAAGAAAGAIGGAFAKNSRRQNTQFSYTPRSGTDIAKGIPKNEPTKLTPGIAGARGLSTTMDNQSQIAGRNELIIKIKEVATMSSVPSTDPKTGQQRMKQVAVANSTKNAGIDSLLASAEVEIQNRQQAQIQRQPQQPQIQQPAGNKQQ
jgi:hypothetical protein